MQTMTGKVVVITGAARGLGRDYAGGIVVDLGLDARQI